MGLLRAIATAAVLLATACSEGWGDVECKPSEGTYTVCHEYCDLYWLDWYPTCKGDVQMGSGSSARSFAGLDFELFPLEGRDGLAASYAKCMVAADYATESDLEDCQDMINSLYTIPCPNGEWP